MCVCGGGGGDVCCAWAQCAAEWRFQLAVPLRRCAEVAALTWRRAASFFCCRYYFWGNARRFADLLTLLEMSVCGLPSGSGSSTAGAAAGSIASGGGGGGQTVLTTQ